MNCRFDQRDAIIVGGGPAGSTLAWKMVTSGWNPLVLDKAHFPREKLCAGWITPPVLETLEIGLDEYRKFYTLQEFHGFEVSRLHGEPVLADYGETVSYGILRREFDHYLLERSGVDCRQGVRVERVERVDGEWLVNGLFRAPLLIGAGGHFCPVARLLGANLKKEKKLYTLELERQLTEKERKSWKTLEHFPEIVYFDDIRGYGWVFRKGSFVNIGVGRTQSRNLRWYLEQFLGEVRRRGKIPPESGISVQDFRGHPYKLHFVTPRTVIGDGVLLVGDAAGVTFNYSGEGIRPAVESAILAWETISALGGAFDGRRLDPYREALYARFGTPVTGWRFRFMESLPPLLFQVIGRTVFALPVLTRRIFVERLFLRRQEWGQQLPGLRSSPG